MTPDVTAPLTATLTVPLTQPVTPNGLQAVLDNNFLLVTDSSGGGVTGT